MVSLLWFALAYSLAFSGAGDWIGNLGAAFLGNLTRAAVHPGTHVPESVFVMFQMTFAIITPALIIGAYVERIRFSAVLLFSALWLLFVYVPVTHWVWGGGWLAQRGVLDFAGGIVVHVTAGVSALVVAWVLGAAPRLSPQRPPAACALDGDGRRLVVVGGLVRLQCRQRDRRRRRCRHDDAGHASGRRDRNDGLDRDRVDQVRQAQPGRRGDRHHRGLGDNHAGLRLCRPGRAVLLGVAGGVICYGAVLLVKRGFGVDDSLDVLGVHGVGGATGTLLLPLVAGFGPGGLPAAMHGGIGHQFAMQLLGVVTVGVWSGAASYAIIKFAQLTVGLRVDREDEIQGLDFASHGEAAYHSGA